MRKRKKRAQKETAAMFHMLPVVEIDDEEDTPLLVLSGNLPKGARESLPDGECYRDEDIGLWVFSYDGAEQFLKSMGGAKLCPDCLDGDECKQSDFPEELDEYYAIDADLEDEEEDEDYIDQLLKKVSKAADEFLRNLADEMPGAAVKPGKEEALAAAAILGLTLPTTKERLDAAYKKAAFKYHPDRGGTNEQMAGINRAREMLAAQL